MDTLPAELYDVIVNNLHDQSCRCSSASSRPAVWDTLPGNNTDWDGQALVLFQRELCNLRLVNKRFFAAATRFFFSHCSLTFDLGHQDVPSIAEKAAYCTSGTNQDVVSQITGVRIRWQLPTNSGLPQSQQPHGGETAAYHSNAAGDAGVQFLSSLPSLGGSLISVTALELHLDRISDITIIRFVRNSVPNLTDFNMKGQAHIARLILYGMNPQQRNNLRRLFISHAGTKTALQPNQLARFPNLGELGLRHLTLGPLWLHPNHRGFTKLHLSHLTAPAAHLLALITKGSSSAAGPSQLNKDSPLVKLVLVCASLNDPEPNSPVEEEEAGTWRSVFNGIRESCAKLKFVRVDFFSYESPDGSQHGGGKSRDADLDGLGLLVKKVRSRPGGVARGAVMGADGVTVRSF